MGKLDPKSTGGGGFDFEDKVGAYFLSFLLVGKELFPSLQLGRLTTIKFQRKVEGWELDDIILEFESDSIKKNLAFSVKSNPYITANKFPADFVELIWKQFCKTEKNPFISKHDYLGLITSGASTAAISSYRKLRNFASKHKGSDLGIHIRKPEFTSQQVRNLFKSFSKPSVVDCNQSIQPTEIIERLIHLDIDLDYPTSLHLREAYDNLTLALINGNAEELWIKCQHMTKTSRSVSGEINFSLLIEELLKSSFKIKGHYQLDSDLKKLQDLREIEVEKIKSTIGKNFSVKRTTDLAKQFRRDQINAFIGESGVGKSVLLKQWVDKSEKHIIWLPYSIFKARTLTEINALLGIQNDLFDILQYGPSEQILVIDAVDRLTSTEERGLLKSFLVKFQKTSVCRHLCVISSQDQIWQTLVGNLSTQEVLFNVIPVPMFKEDELESVARKFPKIAGILKTDPEKEILKNPKYLDIVVQMIEKSSLNENRSISKPLLIQGFWDMLSDGGANQKQLFLTRLAVDQADKNDFLSQINNSESQLVDSLVKEGILKVQDGCIRFSHDLYGDWVRQRFLLSQRAKTIQKIVQRKNNIYWQQAIKLTSLEILETDGFDDWKKKVLFLKEGGDHVLVDLFLDIAITTLNQRFILETIKSLFFSDNFKVLHRFLERFLAYATVPNPQVMSKREEFELDELTATQIHRIPLYNYWPNLLQFLSDNFDNIIDSRAQMAQIAEKWLTSTPYGSPFRKDAAKIIYNCTKWIFEFKQGPNGYMRDDADKKCYQALLAAYPELPNEIKGFCLKLIGLRKNDIEQLPTTVSSDTKDSSSVSGFLMPRRRIEKKVLPNGPQFKKDRDFRDVCLRGQNFGYLVQFNPSLAVQVLLAAIIEDPQEYEDLYSSRQLGTDYTQEFYPPLYSKGPFLDFFKKAPQQALDALISLISLVTDQWAERVKKRRGNVFGFKIEINGHKKFWRGDSNVFSWAINSPCPDVVVTFLMALEKWLYERIDAKEDISPWINQIAEKSDSLALIGILVSVAKYSPKLLMDKLKPLLVLPYVIWWDQQNSMNMHHPTISLLGEEYRFVANLALKWFGMDHRKTSLEQWGIHFLLNDPGMNKFFENARNEWKEKLKEQPDLNLETLIYRFDPANYQIGQLTDGTQVWNYTTPSDFLKKNEQHFNENDAHMIMIMFPKKVNQLLDKPSFTEDEFLKLVKMEEYISSTLQKSDDPLLTTPEDCGLMINGLTLLAAKRKIISMDEEKWKIAKEKIDRTLKKLLDSPEGVHYLPTDQKYDVLAKVIAHLTKGNEQDFWIRTQVARLACNPRSGAITKFVESAVTGKVKHSFLLEILVLIFEYSKVRTAWGNVNYIKRRSSGDNQFHEYTLEERKSLFRNEISVLVEQFVAGNTKKKWPAWDFNPYNYEFARRLNKLPSAEMGIDYLGNFTQAASNLPPMDQWSDSLKAGWINFCTSGLDQISKKLSKMIKKHGGVESVSSQSDKWIINIFAITYYWHEDVKLDQSLRKFFEVGADGHYWIKDFGINLFRLGLKHTECWEQLKSKIEKAFNLALSVKQPQSLQRSWDADEIWCSLVGLDSITIPLLPDDSKPLVSKLLPLYKRLIKTRSGSGKCLSQFIALLLLKKATMDIRIEGLRIVAKELRDVDYADFRQERYISLYSHFLSTLWQENKNELQNNRDAWIDFQQILNGLISVQDPRALQLTSYINSYSD